MKSKKGLGGHKSIVFIDLVMFSNFHLPPGSKTPMFDKYERYGYPIRDIAIKFRGQG